ncbi:MAG: hypothetical protein JNJ73_15380 [Hyphomonadaceae bacterium]|nr:hypothetical protein [Hyphomonadaceae bacterium]
MTHVHFVGSIGFDTAEEVFREVGKSVGAHLKRCPDGEVGGRRLWVSWQYPLLRSSPYLKVVLDRMPAGLGMCLMRVAPGVKPKEIHFGELGYAREAWASYQDFLVARQRGDLPKDVRFQVCLPTPFAIIGAFVAPEDVPVVLPAYEAAMIREVERIVARIPPGDLAIQWDVCIEMIMWDGRFAQMPGFPGMEQVFRAAFQRISAAVPSEAELGVHLCYGDLDAAHFIEPIDTGKAVELANLIAEATEHPLAWVHLPVPADRSDDAYFAPLKGLSLDPGCELFLGLVHAADGAEGTRRRIEAARRAAPSFGIATECGIARSRTVETVREILAAHAQAAQ